MPVSTAGLERLWRLDPITPRALYRRFRTADRLERQDERGAELARRMRVHALREAAAAGISIDRRYFAATHRRAGDSLGGDAA